MMVRASSKYSGKLEIVFAVGALASAGVLGGVLYGSTQVASHQAMLAKMGGHRLHPAPMTVVVRSKQPTLQ
jgi:hypothetical protein